MTSTISLGELRAAATAALREVEAAAPRAAAAVVTTLNKYVKVAGGATWRSLTASNFFWVSTLALAIFGPSAWNSHKHRPEVKRVISRVNALWHSNTSRSCICATGVWLGLRVANKLGVILLVEVVALGGAAHYVWRQEEKRETRLRMDCQRALARPENCRAVLGAQMPRWVTFPSVQKAEWLNTMIVGLWPYVCDSTATVAKREIAKSLKTYKPSFLTKLELAEFTMGTAPISIDGLQHHAISNTETVLDIHMSWRSDGFDFRVAAGVSPLVVVEASVKNVVLRCVCRVTLGPHLSHFPCVGTMSVSFLGTPDIAFDLTAAKLSLDAIPGLGPWMDGFIRNTLVASLVHPRQMLFPIDSTFDMTTSSTAFDHRAKALGRLKMTIHEVRGLDKDGDFYAEVGLVNVTSPEMRKKSSSSSVKKQTCVLDDSAVGSFTVYDATCMVGVWIFWKTFPSTKLIGERIMPISDFLNDPTLNQGQVEWVKRSLELKHPKGKPCKAVAVVSCRFRTFTSGAASTMSMASPMAHQGSREFAALPPRPPGPPHRQSHESFPQAPVTRHPSSRSGSRSGSVQALDDQLSLGEYPVTPGTLFILLDNCKGLKNFEFVGTSDPYVVLSVDSKTVVSQTVDDCLNPVFHFEGELEVENIYKSTLEVKVFDKNVTKDVLMAKTSIALLDVVQSNGQLAKQTWQLTPQGSITMTLTLRAESE